MMQRQVQSVGAGRANLLACAVCRGGCNASHLLRWKPFWYAVLEPLPSFHSLNIATFWRRTKRYEQMRSVPEINGKISRGNNSRRSCSEPVPYDGDNLLLVS